MLENKAAKKAGAHLLKSYGSVTTAINPPNKMMHEKELRNLAQYNSKYYKGNTWIDDDGDFVSPVQSRHKKKVRNNLTIRERKCLKNEFFEWPMCSINEREKIS